MSEIYPEDIEICSDCKQRFIPSEYGCPFCEEHREGDNRAPAGAQERCVGDFTVRTYVGARDRVEVIGNHSGVRYEAPVISRTTIAWVNAVLRCLHQLDAFKQPDAAPTVPHPQPDRAAVKAVVGELADAGLSMDDAWRIASRICGERALSAPGGAGARASEGGGEGRPAPALSIPGGAGGDRTALVERLNRLACAANRVAGAMVNGEEPDDESFHAMRDLSNEIVARGLDDLALSAPAELAERPAQGEG